MTDQPKSDRQDGDGLSERNLACLLANAIFAENLDEMPTQREEHSPSFCQADMLDAAREIQQAGFVVVKRQAWSATPPPTRDSAEGARDGGLLAMLADERKDWRDDLQNRAEERDLERRTITLKAETAVPPKPPPVSWPQDAPPLEHLELLGPDGMGTSSRAEIKAAFGVDEPAPDAVRDELLKAKAALAYLIEHIEYSDSYGVEGSNFMACHLCSGGGAPGVRLVHDAICPVRRCEAVAGEWVAELNDQREDSAAPVPSPDGAGALREIDLIRSKLKVLCPAKNRCSCVKGNWQWYGLACAENITQTTREILRKTALSPSPAVAAEPVAWQKRPTFGDVRIWTTFKNPSPPSEDFDFWREQSYEIRPLYAAPTVMGDREIPSVERIEMVDYSKGYLSGKLADPVWRLKIGGICADFATETWANNFRNAILSLPVQPGAGERE